MDKLTYYGVTPVTNASLKLLKSYLAERSQYVQIDDEMYSLQTIKSGIPQGSIVGPFVFRININDIVKCTDKCNCILYTDDRTLNSTYANGWILIDSA